MFGKKDRKDYVRMKMMEQYEAQLADQAAVRLAYGRNVFISYSAVDQGIASDISDVLKDIDIPHFFDKKDINWGQDVARAVGSGVRNCSHLLVVLSPASLKSSWVAYEIGQAAALGKVILPYLTHPSLDIPDFIRGYHYKSSLSDLRQYLAEPDPAQEELDSTLKSLRSFLPNDLRKYAVDRQESDDRKTVWRSSTPTPMPGRGGDEYGRVVIDRSGQYPLVDINYNNPASGFVVNAHHVTISFDADSEAISLLIRDTNNDGQSHRINDSIAANAAFWERIVQMFEEHVEAETAKTSP